MYIADAESCRQWSDVINNSSFKYYDVELELVKQDVWHAIKKACVHGRYEASFYSAITQDRAAQIILIFQGYGYDISYDSHTFRVSWGKGNGAD